MSAAAADPPAGEGAPGGLKGILATVWAAGDYGKIAASLAASSEEFLARVPHGHGTRLLDIACGTGQLALPAARAGALVTGLDLTEAWLEQARSAAAAEGLSIRFDRGDAEALPYEDGAFDVVVSLIGAMFAPNPDRVAAEMARVCRPGGRIAMGNWTAEGFVGDFFATVARHAPPPEMPSPLLWGDEATVRARLGPRVARLDMERRTLRFDYPGGIAETVRHYAAHFGPMKIVHDTLGPEARAALLADLEAMYGRWATPAAGGGLTVEAEILEIHALR